MAENAPAGGDENEAKLLEFQEICAVDDENLARSFLERYGWDLQTAVQEYLAEKDGAPAERIQNEDNRRRVDDNAVSRRPVQPPMGFVQWSWSLITLPFRFVYSTMYDLLGFIYRLLFMPARAIGDPVGDVEKFVADYEAKYGSSHPVFYRGTYSNALNDAKKEFKFLVVYLHCETHRDTDKFCQQTLANQAVIDFINTNNTLFWACSVRTSEGFRVSQAMRETTYPFVALVAMRENKMMIVLRQEGFCPPHALREMLSTAVADNEIYVNAARQERQQQQMNQTLRQQQEQAFQETLRLDREKERRKVEEQQKLVAEAEAALQREQNEKDRREALLKRKEEIRERLPAEPDVGDVDCVRVRLTFPSGAKLERRFRSSDSMELLYDVTLCHPDCPYNFSIVNGFPRRVLPVAPNTLTFSEEGLLKSVTLIVQDNDA